MPLIEIKLFDDEFRAEQAPAASKPSRTRWCPARTTTGMP
jgi:hypothetical protein